MLLLVIFHCCYIFCYIVIVIAIMIVITIMVIVLIIKMIMMITKVIMAADDNDTSNIDAYRIDFDVYHNTDISIVVMNIIISSKGYNDNNHKHFMV